jgi:hypothetical protein
MGSVMAKNNSVYFRNVAKGEETTACDRSEQAWRPTKQAEETDTIPSREPLTTVSGLSSFQGAPASASRGAVPFTLRLVSCWVVWRGALPLRRQLRTMDSRVKEANARAAQLVVSPRTKTAETKGDEKERIDAKLPKKQQRDKLQQNDDDDAVEYVEGEDEDEWSDSDESDDDAKSCTSNQTEDDDDDNSATEDNDPEGSDKDETEAESQENDREDIHLEEKIEVKLSAPVKSVAVLPPPVIRPLLPTKPVPAVLSVPAIDANKRGIHEPRPPRGSAASMSGGGAAHASNKIDNNKARQKFQFPDAELLKLVLEEDMLNSMKFTSSTNSRSGNGGTQSRRRFSSTAAVMGTSLPLRRKSFSLTKGPVKSPASASSSPPSIAALPPFSPASANRFQARRKSTSAAYSVRGGVKSPQFNKNLVSSLPPLPRAASASPLVSSGVLLPTTSTSTAPSQMVVRVRERKSDGRPELVISKRPARFLVWNWNDRQIRVPFNIQLGPHQHGVMLRQLRYVKSVMNDFPWAKTHLKDLLAAYTKKDMSKEELYPQLNMLSHQVQQEIGVQVKKQKHIMAKKQHLTMQLSLATSMINEIHITKYGRRGKPHDTKLYYDPGQPTKLHWIRKNGERSSESLEVDLIEVHCYDADSKEKELSAGIKKAVKKFSQTASLESCVSLVTPLRTLDVQLKSTMHREWLMNALCDVISFARQYRAAGARRDNATQHQQTSHVLRRM